MKFRNHQKIVKISLTLSFLWILNCCSYQHPPIRYIPDGPPTPAEIKTKTDTITPKTPTEPTKKTLVRVAKMPDKIVPKPRVLTPKTPFLSTPPQIIPGPHYFEHKVLWPGETISVIAKWYTGSVKNWKALANANPKLNPKQITIGDSIFIPETLLTSRKPMPLSFLTSQNHTKNKPSYPSNQTSMNSDSPKLFGPIDSEQTSINSNAVELFAPVE